MRLVVSGYFGFGNTGDEALLAGLLRTLRQADADLEVTVLSGDPTETERTHAVRAIGRARPSLLWRELRRSDGLLSGGGSLLQDRTSGRPVVYYTGVMALARLAGRRYVVHAQGLGPIERGANRLLARTALARAAAVSLRDPESIELARSLGVRRRIDLVPDTALAITPTGGGPDGPLVVALRPWGSHTAYLSGLRGALRMLALDHRIVALPMQDRVDREVSRAVVEGIPNAAVASRDLGLDERIALIGSASAVVGMRLHALVLAAAAGVPAVAVAYDPKVTAFARLVGQEVAGDVSRALDPDAVADAVRRAQNAEPEPYRARVEELRAALRPAAARALAALRGE